MKMMKFRRYIPLLVLVSLVCGAHCLAQESSEKKIELIRTWYDDINKKIDTFTKVTDQDINVYKDINPERYSYESTEIFRLGIINLERFYNDKMLVKAKVTFEGDRDDLTSEYYFHDQQLFFVFKKRIQYQKPKWDKAFDAREKNVLENRFYFDNNKLIRWIDASKNMKKSSDPKFKIKEHQILSDANLYREIEHKK